ncbi:MAG: FimV/HubP family polar landmark protein, partial [Pseudomonadota bacterium]|nr:FimV/HubP family polar landmark protein [Pseudomonadota bacterium]
MLLLFFLPFAAQALGLGSLRVNSRIGEPLNLYIELLSASPADIKTLTVELASREDFRRIGLHYPEEAAQVRFQVEGNRGIRITTDEPVDAAYLHFLVAASWSGGKLVREYTALLDPPLYKKRAPSAKALPTTPPRHPQATAPRADTYTVAGGDNLSSIVKRLGLASSVSSHQAMMALYHANPRAFSGNINLLKKGATLRIPSSETMQQLDRKTARAEFSDQWRRYKEGRRKKSATPPPPSQPAA